MGLLLFSLMRRWRAMKFYSDLELARRLERLEGSTCRKFVEARARVDAARGACSMEAGGAYAMFDGPASPITQTFGLGMFEAVTPEVLDELEQFFARRGAPVHHEVSPFAGVEVYALLVERGYRPIELTSILYRDVRERLEGAVNPRVKVQVTDDVKLWTDVNARGWASEQPELLGFLRNFGSVIAAKLDTVMFLSELEGMPIAAGSMNLGDSGAVLLSGAATIPEGRRQGAQFALLEARLRYAAERGYELAMMGAAVGSSSQRNAERHGFRIAYTRVKWMK